MALVDENNSYKCAPVCDFCCNYKDYNTDGKFIGVGACVIDNSEVLASDFCDDFKCAFCSKNQT